MSVVNQEPLNSIDSNVAVSLTSARVPEHDHPLPRVGHQYAAQVLLTSAPLLASDLLAITASTLLVFGLVELIWPDLSANPRALLVFLCGTQSISYLLFRLYPGTGLNPIVEFRQASIATALLFALFVAASLVHDGRQGYPLLLAATCGLAIVNVPVLRSITRQFFSRYRWWGQPVLVFGSNETGVANYKYFNSHPALGLRAIGIVDDRNQQGNGHVTSRYLGPLGSAPSIAERHSIFWAIIAMPECSQSQIHQIMETHASSFPHVLVVPDMAGLPSLWNRTCECGGLPGIQMQTNLLLPLPQIIKRTLDLSLVVIGGLLCLPLILLITVLIKATSRGPAFYGHTRIGYGNRRFRAWKFRTMVINAEEVLQQYLDADPRLREEWQRDQKLKNDPRVTKIGHWLRKTSLDELPQIWNVLRGEMSLVGPRPIVDAEVVKYGSRFQLYKKVLPGISGLWQVSGRNNTTYAERVRLDSYYVQNWSPWLDLYILARTVNVVLRRDGAY